MRSVAILGCGPAGLMVAHAANIMDWDFKIYSKKQKSKLYGAQYLHKPIPQLDCGAPMTVAYKMVGSPRSYRFKVYGPGWDGTVSPEDFTESHFAWDIRKAYDDLWNVYSGQIENCDLDPDARQVLNWMKYDLVISTIPRKIWAEDGDVFESQKVWALGDTENKRVHLYRPEPFTVVCDGTSKVDWYRVSNIFGHCTMEWPYIDCFNPPPAVGASIVEKPLRHNSKAANDFIHLGRFGKWEKGVLSTDAFYDALKVFAMDGIESGR